MIPQNFFQMIALPGNAVSSLSLKADNSGGGSEFGGIFKQLLSEASGAASSGGEALLSQDTVSDASAINLINYLKMMVMKDTGGLKDILVDENALADFKQILLGMGFKEADVNSFFENLSVETEDGEIMLSDLFSSLETFDWDSVDESEGQEIMLDISMLPHLTSTLSSLGLDDAEIEAVVSDAKIEGEGINLSVLLENLKDVQSSRLAGGNNDTKTTSDVNVFTEITNSMEEILAHLQIADTVEDSGQITLDEFIQGLEQVVGKPETTSSAADAIDNSIKRFAEKMKNGKSTTASEVSLRFIEEKMKAEMIKTAGTKENGMFGDLFASSDTIGEVFEEAFLGEAVSAEDSDILEDSEFLSSLINKNINKADLENKATQNLSANGPENTGRVAQKHGEESAFSIENLVKQMNVQEDAVSVGKESTPQRSLPSYVISQVGRQIARSIDNGENEVKFQIKPPHLGRIQMTIDNSPDGFKISILAEQNATKDLILAHSSELKALMADQGLKINGIDVNVFSDFPQTMADAHQQDANSRRRGQQQGKDDDVNYEGIMVESGVPIEELSYRAGVLDVLV